MYRVTARAASGDQPDGRFVAFLSTSSNLGTRGDITARQIFLRDTCAERRMRAAFHHAYFCLFRREEGEGGGSAPAISAEDVMCFCFRRFLPGSDDANQFVTRSSMIRVWHPLLHKATWASPAASLGPRLTRTR